MKRTVINLISKIFPILFCLAFLWAGLGFVPAAVTSVGVGPADETLLKFQRKDIYIDGKRFDNFSLERAVTKGVDGFYIPATEEILSALGIDFLADEESKCFFVRKKEPDLSLLEKGRGKSVSDLDTDFSGVPLDPDYMLITASGNSSLSEAKKLSGKLREGTEYQKERVRCYYANLSPYALRKESSEEVFSDNGEGAKNFSEEEAPELTRFCTGGVLLGSDGMYYLSEAFLKEFGISFYEDPVSGIWISSDPAKDAKETHKEAPAIWIETLSEYMMKRNKDLTRSEAIYYEYLFRRAETFTGVDELILISVAKAESGFHAESMGNGSAGLMQPLVKYAANYGYTKEMLLDPRNNITLCSGYLRDRYAVLDDDILALSAYNQGLGAVKSGNFRPGYARRVLKTRDELLSLLKEAGGEI